MILGLLRCRVIRRMAMLRKYFWKRRTGKFPVEKIINSRIQVSDVVEQGFEKLTTKSNNALKILVRSD
jgi:hypothetical protein